MPAAMKVLTRVFLSLLFVTLCLTLIGCGNIDNEGTGALDVLIVGGGASGCWFSERLKRLRPSWKVQLVEKEGRIGGRLKSDDNYDEGSPSDPFPIKRELGGMRLFPSVMRGVLDLYMKYNLTSLLRPLELEDSNNIFYTGGVAIPKKNVTYPAGGPWAGQKISAMTNRAKQMYKKTAGFIEPPAAFRPLYDPYLQGLTVQKFLHHFADATDEEVKLWEAYGGYNVHHGTHPSQVASGSSGIKETQASIWVGDGELYGAELSHQYFTAGGFQQLVTEMCEAGVKPTMNTEVYSLRKDTAGFLIANTSSGEIKTRRVVIGVDALQVRAIGGLESLLSSKRFAATKAAKSIALFKAFLDFDTPWWEEFNLTNGKSTSHTGEALDPRQIHYYDKRNLLIYNSDAYVQAGGVPYATNWRNAFRANRTDALRSMFETVKTIHVAYGVPASEIPEPNWDKCVWAYWPSGSHKMVVGENINEVMRLLANGSGDNSSIAIVGDAYSNVQGWVQGALNSAEAAWEQTFADVL